MSAEKTLELLKKLKEDPKAKELLNGLKKPAPADDVITCYAQIAAKLGYAITAEEIREVVNQEEARRKSETEKISSDMEALNDDDVEDVVGGVYYYKTNKIMGIFTRTRVEGCVHDYTDDDCALRDACDDMYNTYYGCSSRYHQE